MHPDSISLRINLAISSGLLAQVDDLAKRSYMSRSGLIRAAILEYLREPGNAARLVAKPSEDVELRLFLEQYQKDHPQVKLWTPPED